MTCDTNGPFSVMVFDKDLKIFSYKVSIIHWLLEIDRETHLTYAHAIRSCAYFFVKTPHAYWDPFPS